MTVTAVNNMGKQHNKCLQIETVTMVIMNVNVTCQSWMKLYAFFFYAVSADNVASHGVTGEYESMFSYQDIDTSYPARPVHTTETSNQTSFQQRFPNQVKNICVS